MTEIRNDRLTAALDRAVAGGDPADLFELLRRGSGLPGVDGAGGGPKPRAGSAGAGLRPNLELARAVGHALARHEGRADRLVAALAGADDEYLRIVAALTFGARSLQGLAHPGGRAKAASDARRARPRVEQALADLQTLAEDPRHLVRAGVVDALRMRLAALGEPAVVDLAAWTDGYLQAHVALEALADRSFLTTLPAGESVIARLDEAFVLADGSPRAAERSQGMRALRQGMPAQIATFAARFPETLAWLEEKTRCTRPETREVVEGAIRSLRRTVISDVEAVRLGALLSASGKPRRDADRVVQGTRRRGRGRT
jgi:hypothetical protein